MVDLLSLNQNQREAVLWDKGALLVLAGPGSGKTRVLTYRIANILEQSEGKYFRILALTFTNKAAAEMRSRVEELVPKSLNRIRLTTFHSFAAELLQQHGSHLNFRPDFQILSNNADREALLDDVLREIRKNIKHTIPEHFKAARFLPIITRLLEKCVPTEHAEEVLQESNVKNATLIAQLYSHYRSALRKNNSLDFPSLLAETLDLLRKFPFLAKHIRKVYKHILVDEFQDTNDIQYQILSLITKPNSSTLFVVGDDDQIIYQWNGASPERIQELRDDFDVAELQLPENYRCPPLVIKLANSLIEKNLSRSAGKKPLEAVKPGEGGEIVRVFDFKNIDQETKWIAQDIAQREPQDQNNCVVLARTKKLVEKVGDELRQAGIPVFFSLRKDEFRSAPLRMLHSILKLVNSKEDKQSLARLSKAFYEIEGIRIKPSSVLERASTEDEDLLRSWLDEVKLRDDLEASTQKLLGIDIKSLLSSLNYRNFSEKLLEWAANSKSKSQQDESTFDEFEEERNVWQSVLTEVMKKFKGEEVSLHQLLQELDLVSKTPPKEPGAIPCFTVHASKGLEFGHVYLIGLVEDQFPSWAAVKKGDQSLEIQEERRNCFVAITRAQESLTLTFSARVFGYRKKPSRFLTEMGVEI